MTGERRQIFRDRAIQHYAQRQEKAVLPHLIAPPAFASLWLLLILFMIVTGLLFIGLIGTIGG